MEGTGAGQTRVTNENFVFGIAQTSRQVLKIETGREIYFIQFDSERKRVKTWSRKMPEWKAR